MPNQLSPPSASATGGAADEAGGHYRRAVATLFAAYGLNGTSFPGLPNRGTEAVVRAVGLETNFPTDDLLVAFPASRLYVQAKRTLHYGRPMREIAPQWLNSVRDHRFDANNDLLAAVAQTCSAPIRDLGYALLRRRHDAVSFSSRESAALLKLTDLLRRHGAQDAELASILSRAVILPFMLSPRATSTPRSAACS